MPTLAPEAPLSVLLREGTRAEHQEAESEGFVSRLISGDLDVAPYAALAARQLSVYAALEEARAVVRHDARGASLVFDELTRVPAIERDLAHLYGPGWRSEIRVLPA